MGYKFIFHATLLHLSGNLPALKIANRKQILDNYGKIAVGQHKLVQDMPWFWKVDVYSSMK